MRRLYQYAFKRLYSKLVGKEQPAGAKSVETAAYIPAELPSSLLNISHDILHRLARDDFRIAVRVPCHVQDPTKYMAIVQASKRLRLHTHTYEAKICFKCPHKMACPVSGKPPNSGLLPTAIQDIIAHFEALSKMPEDKVANRIWNSSYKICDSIPVIIDDLKEGGAETKEYEAERQRVIKEAEYKLAELKKKQDYLKLAEGIDKSYKLSKKAQNKYKQSSKTKVREEREEYSSSSYLSYDLEGGNFGRRKEQNKMDSSTFGKKYRGNPAVEKASQKGQFRYGSEKDRKDPFKYRERDIRRNSSNKSFGSDNNFVKKYFSGPRSNERDRQSPANAKNHNKFKADTEKFERYYYRYDSKDQRNYRPTYSENDVLNRSMGSFMRNDGPRQPTRKDRQPYGDSPKTSGRFDGFRDNFGQATQKPAPRNQRVPSQNTVDRKVYNLYTEALKPSETKGPKYEAKATSAGRRVRGRRGE